MERLILCPIADQRSVTWSGTWGPGGTWIGKSCYGKIHHSLWVFINDFDWAIFSIAMLGMFTRSGSLVIGIWTHTMVTKQWFIYEFEIL